MCAAQFTAGQTGYLDGADNRWKLAIATGQASAAARGIATANFSTGQIGRFQTAETLNLGGGVAVGTVYVVSTNAGGIAPVADVTATNWITPLAVGATTNNLSLNIFRSGIQKV